MYRSEGGGCQGHLLPTVFYYILKKYKTFSVLMYSYINTSGNWKNDFHTISSFSNFHEC